MTREPPHPRFTAIAIGPGGVPPDEVTFVGADPVTTPEPTPPAAFGASDFSAEAGTASGWIDAAAFGDGGANRPASGSNRAAVPSAVFGSFDEDARPSRRAIAAWLAVVLVAAVTVAALLWSDQGQPLASSAGLQPGACLTSSAGQAVSIVDCSAPEADFTVAARFDGSSNSGQCTSVSSDLVLVTRDEAVLCLNYRATVGDCLFAGRARDIGKAPCRTPGTSSTPPGLFRVIAVLSGTIDAAVCPTGTIESLVHVTGREVLCLGLP